MSELPEQPASPLRRWAPSVARADVFVVCHVSPGRIAPLRGSTSLRGAVRIMRDTRRDLECPREHLTVKRIPIRIESHD